MSQVADQEARPNIHYEWLKDIYVEINKLDPNLLSKAIQNLKDREVIE